MGRRELISLHADDLSICCARSLPLTPFHIRSGGSRSSLTDSSSSRVSLEYASKFHPDRGPLLLTPSPISAFDQLTLDLFTITKVPARSDDLLCCRRV